MTLFPEPGHGDLWIVVEIIVTWLIIIWLAMQFLLKYPNRSGSRKLPGRGVKRAFKEFVGGMIARL